MERRFQAPAFGSPRFGGRWSKVFRFKLGAPLVLAGCAAAGMAWWAAGG